MKLACVFLFLALRASMAQSPLPVELYGPEQALEAYNALGTNISSTNEWEYESARAAHIVWGRFDCPWQEVERQKLPANQSGGYSLPRACASGLTYARQFGVHPIVDALYGAPYGRIASAVTTADAPIGATVIPIAAINGDIDHLMAGQSYLKLGTANISSRHAYAGTLILSKTAESVTLASALNRAVPRGSAVTINLQLYPPVSIPPGTSFVMNPSIRAYGSYVHFLQTQVAASGMSGRVSIWNEPPWAGDPWDDAANLYDKPPAENRLKPLFGVELAYYASTLPVVAGAPLDNGYTNKTGGGSLLEPDRRLSLPSTNDLRDRFASESFHPYGNNPEDAAWIPSCVKAHNTSQMYGKVFNDCTPAGMVTGSNIKWEAAFNAPAEGFQGLPLAITETGLCRCGNTATIEEQISRFDLRQFLVYTGSGVHPIVFYRLAGDPHYEWLRPDHSPYPVYVAFQHLLKGLSLIANPTIRPPSATPPLTVKSYIGTYPLAMVVFAGSRPGDSENSFAVYTWQRTYSAGKWVDLASPYPSALSMTLPSNLDVVSVKDLVTSTPLSYAVHERTLTYSVADNPVEVILIPRHS